VHPSGRSAADDRAVAEYFFPMMKLLLKRHILKNRTLILQESQYFSDFIQLLMKRRNMGIEWTEEEITRLKSYLKHLSLYVPALIIFILPFGLFLLPVLAEILDRREKSRAN
jgi:hypothetical protein